MAATLKQIPASGPVRYLKLGERGILEDDCTKDGSAYFGFGMYQADRRALWEAGRWDELRALLLTTSYAGKPSVATNVTRQARAFFEDDGTTVWITFHDGRMFWSRFLPGSTVEHRHGRDGVWRRVDGGWRHIDIAGDELEMAGLSGRLTQLVGFRGTSCAVRPDDLARYARRRINAQTIPEIEQARATVARLTEDIVPLMRLLEPRDFETLVDLVFSTSGWRRLGPVGGTAKTIDLELELPTTGQQAFVQVKARATTPDLAEYVTALTTRPQDAWMFFVYHTGKVKTDDPRVRLVGPRAFAEMVLNAGLTSWLIKKTA